MASGDPADYMKIPQAAWPLLDVRFEIVAGVVIARVPEPLLLALGCVKAPAGPKARCVQPVYKVDHKARIAGQQACLHEIGHDSDIIGRCGHAVPD